MLFFLERREIGRKGVREPVLNEGRDSGESVTQWVADSGR